MSRYIMQVNVAKPGQPTEWRSVKATGSPTPYSYPTAAEARRMLEMCYPDQCLLDDGRTVRITKEN